MMTLEVQCDLPMLVSFSGGRTSAFMTKFLKERYPEREMVILFSNTGKEKEETLNFVDECDQRWGLNVVWLEAKVNEKGSPTTFNVVDHNTASRKGQPFESVIKKYGIPSKQFPHCTRELKQQPMITYMRSIGYDDWVTAVGIRFDEQHRRASASQRLINPIYPLIDDIKATEGFIRHWWKQQEFDLQIKDYEGNCDLCWKKSKRKRLTLLSEDPDVGQWWREMEDNYGDGQYIFDQRDGLSISKQISLSKKPFTKAIDLQEQRDNSPILFDPKWDVEMSCLCKST